MRDRFDKQFFQVAATMITACVLKLGGLVETELGYSTAGAWTDDVGSILLVALLALGIRSIARKRRKWDAVPMRTKTTLIIYYIIVVAATIASILGHAGRLLSSVTLLLSAVFFTMVAMVNYTPQTDVDCDNTVQK